MSKIIAYLAPEIPALSATFVSNEILALQKKGLTVIPFSVIPPLVRSKTPQVEALAQQVFYLYNQPIHQVLIRSLKVLIRLPTVYLVTLQLVFQDIFKLGWKKIDSYKLLYQFLQGSQLAYWLTKQNCEHLHIHFAHTPTQIGMYGAKLAQIPFSFTAHANDLFERGRLLKEKVDRSHFTIVISEYNKQFLAQKNASIEKIKVVRCGVNTEHYPFSPPSKFNAIPIIGSLGRLVEKKGMDDLISAISILEKRGFNCQLEIGGDGELREQLEKLIKTSNLEGKVTWKGKLEHHEVFTWLKTIDLFVLACKPDQNGDQDGIPVVLMEAMMMGVPVISTELSGIPELIQNGYSGELALPNNPQSLADAIQRYLTQGSIMEKTKNAREQVKIEFDEQVNIDRLIKLFQEKT